MQDLISTSPEPRLEGEARECVAEIGEILALGLVRLRARQSSQVSAEDGESSVACIARQSGDANSETENGE